MGGFNSHLVSSAVYTLPYDVLRDFEPVALLSRSGGGLIVAGQIDMIIAADVTTAVAQLRAGAPGMTHSGSIGF